MSTLKGIIPAILTCSLLLFRLFNLTRTQRLLNMHSIPGNLGDLPSTNRINPILLLIKPQTDLTQLTLELAVQSGRLPRLLALTCRATSGILRLGRRTQPVTSWAWVGVGDEDLVAFLPYSLWNVLRCGAADADHFGHDD